MGLANRKTGNGHTAKRIIISDDNDVDEAATEPPAEHHVHRPHLPARAAPTGTSTGKKRKEQAAPLDPEARDPLADLEAALRQHLDSPLRLVLAKVIVAIADKNHIGELRECINTDVLKFLQIDHPTPVTPKFEHIDALFEGLSSGFENRVSELETLTRKFRQRTAAELEPVLNAYIRETIPHDDLDGKRRVCEFVDKTLKPLGLAVEVPNTSGLPGRLRASTGHWPGVGRFYFEIYVDGKVKKPAVSDTLPTLKLTDANPAIRPDLSWEAKIGPKTSQSGRKVTD